MSEALDKATQAMAAAGEMVRAAEQDELYDGELNKKDNKELGRLIVFAELNAKVAQAGAFERIAESLERLTDKQSLPRVGGYL